MSILYICTAAKRNWPGRRAAPDRVRDGPSPYTRHPGHLIAPRLELVHGVVPGEATVNIPRHGRPDSGGPRL